MDFVTPIMFAFIVTALAGLATALGGAIALLAKRTNTKFFSLSLGLSAGVMIYISFMELLPTAIKDFATLYSAKSAYGWTILSFFIGIALIAVIDLLVPSADNPHEPVALEEMKVLSKHKAMRKIGVMMALSIGIHNFPEGMATFSAMMNNYQLGIPIAVAVAIHNIPEGIAIAVPIYQATGSRRKAFWYSMTAGLAEPLGALFGFLFLMPFWTPFLSGMIMAATAGIMVYISLDELLPSARKYGHHHYAIGGLVLGMFVMAISLYLML